MKANYNNKKRRRFEPEKTMGYIGHIDYKRVDLLQKYITPYGKMLSRKKTALCAKNQRELTLAIKRARFLGLIPYVATRVKD